MQKKLIEHLYQRPAVNAKNVSEIIGKSIVTSYDLMSELQKRNILKEITGAGRDRIYVFEDYLALFEDDV